MLLQLIQMTNEKKQKTVLINFTGYKTNKNFPTDDKCVICLRHLDSEKMSETLSLSHESCSLNNLSSHTHMKTHGSLNINNSEFSGDPNISTSPDGGVMTSGGVTGTTRKSRSVSWSNMYKQKLFSGTSALSGIAKQTRKQRVVKMRNCPHSYHSECIKQWMKTNNSCPLCKTRVNSRMLLTFHPHSSPYFSIVTV